MDLDQLQQLLETQYGNYIRDSKYKQAFDRAMAILSQVEEPPATIDNLYLFLHVLVLELFHEIEQLSEQLSK